LIKLGIPDDKLRITYVIYKKANSRFEQAHMVLTYYHKTGAEPVILDNINKRLQLASKRMI
jgi:predicted transglutaminase-like cysteine proteinase